MPKKTETPALESFRAEQIIQAAQDTKAEDIQLYDLENQSPIADYVVICSGRSQAHVRGIVDNIEDALRKADVRCSAVEGYSEGSWILMDYSLVIVHVFHPETRTYYDLEELLKGHPTRHIPSEDAKASQA